MPDPCGERASEGKHFAPHDCGHVCCDDRANTHHDHWLTPDDCTRCDWAREATDA